jgi:PAS domain S-box-containing protein
LVLTSRPQPPHRRLWPAEAVGLIAALVAVSAIAFSGSGIGAYATLPLLFWIALRFGQPGAVCGGLLVAGFAVWFTKHGQGPFVGGSLDSALLRAQTFVGVATVTALLVAAVRSEQRSSAEAEESLREVLDASPDGTVIVDEHGQIVLVSSQALRLFGAAGDQLVGTSVELLIPGMLRDRHRRHREEFVRAPQARPMGSGLDLSARRQDGTEFPVEIRLSPITFESRPAVIASVRDITDRKAGEEALRRAEQRFRAAFELAPVGMSLIGSRPENNGRYLAVNRAFAEMLGFDDPNELSGRHYSEFSHPTELPMLQAGRPGLMSEGYMRAERRFLTSDGRELWTEVHVALIRGADGEPDHMVSQVLDLTDRRRSESELRQGAAIAGNLAEGVFMTRVQDRRVVYANARSEQLFGFGPGELVGLDAGVLVPPDDDSGRALSDAIARERRWSGEIENVRRDGTRIWCYANVSEFEHPEHGTVWISALSDITASKRAQAEAQRLAEVVESSAEAIIRSDADGVIVSWNPGAERIFGYTAEEVLGKTGHVLVPAGLLAEREGFWENISTRAVVGVETQRVRKDGQLIDVVMTISPINDESGRLVGTSAILRDITEQRRQASALLEAEERFRGAFENAPIGMALVGPDGRWLRVNRAVCEIVGYTEQEMLERSFQDITHPDDLDTDLERVRQMLAGEIRTYQMDKRYIHRDGRIVWITLSVSLVHDSAGEPLYFVSQIEDVTERKRSQVALEATVEIARAVAGETELDRVLEVIAERSRSLLEASSLAILLSDGEELVVAAAAGALQPTLVGKRVTAAASIAERVRTSGRAERIDRLASSPGFALGALGVTAASTLVVPLGFRSARFGVIEAFDRAGGPEFGDEDERLLLAAAASAGIAVATAQSVGRDRVRRTLRAAEDERRRWARELHDETLQALGGLRMLLSSAHRSADEQLLRRVAQSALEQLDTEIESLRVLISELRPAALDELGLHSALLALAERTSVTHGIDVTTTFDGAAGARGKNRLDPELDTVVYRVVQEALTNAARHGHPETVAVQLRYRNGMVRVSVTDDGRGFDTSEPAAGFGLLGMRERVSLVGGQFELSSSPGGTTVEISLPVAAAISPRLDDQ